MNSPHPRIILVGAKGTGKSILASRICGILLGTSTTCPVEWHLRPSSIWSASVYVAYFKSTLWSSKLSLDNNPRVVLDIASTPLELWYLVRRAELLAFSADKNPSTILALSEDDVDREYINILLSSSHSRGVIYVDLQCPGYISNQLTVVDLPGLTRSGYSSTINYTKALARYCTMENKKCIVALFTRSSEQEREARALFKLLFRNGGKNLPRMTMIIAHTEAQAYIDPFWLDALSNSGKLPWRSLCFRTPDQHGPAALSSDIIKQNQQDEIAYFLFCKPWSTHPTKCSLGVVNILKEWDDQWNSCSVEDVSSDCDYCHVTLSLRLNQMPAGMIAVSLYTPNGSPIYCAQPVRDCLTKPRTRKTFPAKAPVGTPAITQPNPRITFRDRVPTYSTFHINTLPFQCRGRAPMFALLREAPTPHKPPENHPSTMFSALAFIPFFGSSPKAVELPVFSHQISTKNFYRLNCLKLNRNGLLAAGNEDGAVVIFNLLSQVDRPQQVRQLGFEAGGVSDLFWINAETLAVGTTRGRIVLYSMKNEAARFSEVCNVKAHGDGVSHISVESIDYCPTTQTLASVGEGVGSIKVWKFTPEDGQLTPQPMPSETRAFRLPRFVSFTDNGSKIMVGYLQDALVQTFSLQPWALIEERTLGEEHDDASERSHLGNASLLEASGLLAIFNLTRGLDFYDSSTFVRKYSATHPVHEDCNQGLATLRGGSYLASAARDGVIHIFQTIDASLAVKLKIPGRAHQIDAIHGSKCGSREFMIASSCKEGKASILTIWCYKNVNQTKQYTASDHSTLRLVILCIAISVASQFIASISPLVQKEVLSRFTHDKQARLPPEVSKLASDLMQETLSTASQQGPKTSSILTAKVQSVAIRRRNTTPKSESSVEVIAL